MPVPKQKVLLHAFKYATLTLAGVVAVIIVTALLREGSEANISGRLLNAQERGEIPRTFFTAERAFEGFTAPADTHVIFTIPQNTRILAMTFLGGPDYDKKIRYWFYCFSGNEEANKSALKRGRQLYDGKLSSSTAEREAQRIRPPGNDDLLGIKQSEDLHSSPEASDITVFKGGETCYLMSQAPLPLGMDSDDDNLNNALERNIGTNPATNDTDGDGITDGREVFFSKTSPTLWDTDGDNLSDGFEDKNQDGPSMGETSALLGDTDRDGLCDGDGYGPGCPEPVSYPFRGEDFNNDGIVDPGETDPKKKDTDGNGHFDLDEKWDDLQARGLGNRR